MSDDVDIVSILEEQKSHIASVAQRHSVPLEIHPKDMLFDFFVRTVFRSSPSQAVDAYFAGGEECCRRFAALYTGSGKTGGAVLEFASGYGRVARHSRKVLPDVRWVCCDIHPEAVEFNEWTVGVQTILSSTRPEHLDVGGATFDAVFALSFFSHMPDETFGVWLAKLYQAVAVDGILVFTTHGEVTARNMRVGGLEVNFDDNGFFWNSASDQRDLDIDEYGTSVVSFDYVHRAIERLPNYDLIRFQQAFWWGHQDLYVIRKLPTSSKRSRSGDKMSTAIDVNFPPETWANFNALPGLEHLAQASLIAPFPPRALMHRVSGLTEEKDFAQHGKDIFLALSQASPKPLASFRDILDFGVGSGRLARMFLGFKGHYFGVDIDHELINWASSTMPWVTPIHTSPKEVLPCQDAAFDLVVSVSVFTHMNEQDSIFYLRELHRVTKPGATLLLTVHGERALERAEAEEIIFNMLSVERADIEATRRQMQSPGFTFITQPHGHLTTDQYEYGISFTGENYIKAEWGKLFGVQAIRLGAIYDFQDIVVLSR